MTRATVDVGSAGRTGQMIRSAPEHYLVGHRGARLFVYSPNSP
jgi:hypothetical protein